MYKLKNSETQWLYLLAKKKDCKGYEIAIEGKLIDRLYYRKGKKWVGVYTSQCGN